MAKISDTTTFPKGCSYPSFSGLSGIEPVSFDDGQELRPSMFGPEFDAINEDFQRKHVDPHRRADYFLRTSGKLKDRPSE